MNFNSWFSLRVKTSSGSRFGSVIGDYKVNELLSFSIVKCTSDSYGNMISFYTGPCSDIYFF